MHSGRPPMREHEVTARVVCDRLGVSKRLVLRSRLKSRRLVRARWMCALILYRWGLSLDDIASGFVAYQDHTGARWAVTKAMQDPLLAATAKELYPAVTQRLRPVRV